MTIKTIKDLPDCVRKLVELYYTSDSSTAFAQSAKSRNQYPEHALLIDTTVELFHNAPESMYAFYDVLLERLASKPVRQTSSEANFNTQEDVSETSQSPLFDDIFAAALNASFNDTPYLRPPAPSVSPASTPEDAISSDPIPAARPNPNGRLLKPVQNFSPIPSRPGTISVSKPQLDDDSYDPFRSLENDPLSLAPAAPSRQTAEDPLNLGIDNVEDEFDLNIELDESFSEFERDDSDLNNDPRAFPSQDMYALRSPASLNQLGRNRVPEDTAPPISLFQALSPSSPNPRPSSTPTTVVSGSDILNLINSSHSFSKSSLKTQDPASTRAASATAAKQNSALRQSNGFSLSSSQRSKQDSNEATSTPRSFMQSKPSKKSMFAGSADPLHLDANFATRAPSVDSLADTQNPNLNETSAPCIVNSQDLLRSDPDITQAKVNPAQRSHLSRSESPIMPASAPSTNDEILRSLATFMDDDDDEDAFGSTKERDIFSVEPVDIPKDKGASPSFRRSTHNFLNPSQSFKTNTSASGQNNPGVEVSSPSKPSLAMDLNMADSADDPSLRRPGNRANAPRAASAEHRSPTLEPGTRSDPTYRRISSDIHTREEVDDIVSEGRLLSSTKRSASANAPLLSDNIFSRSDSLGSRRAGGMAVDSKSQGQTLNYISAVSPTKNRNTAVGVHPVTQNYLTPASTDTLGKNNAPSMPRKDTFETDALMALHPLSRMPVLCISMGELSRRTDIDSKAGFIISLIDGTVSLADILSLSAWSQTETAAIICKLEANHIITFEG